MYLIISKDCLKIIRKFHCKNVIRSSPSSAETGNRIYSLRLIITQLVSWQDVNGCFIRDNANKIRYYQLNCYVYILTNCMCIAEA